METGERDFAAFDAGKVRCEAEGCANVATYLSGGGAQPLSAFCDSHPLCACGNVVLESANATRVLDDGAFALHGWRQCSGGITVHGGPSHPFRRECSTPSGNEHERRAAWCPADAVTDGSDCTGSVAGCPGYVLHSGRPEPCQHVPAGWEYVSTGGNCTAFYHKGARCVWYLTDGDSGAPYSPNAPVVVSFEALDGSSILEFDVPNLRAALAVVASAVVHL